jgi:coenzyme PQQ precursor peptide PqqA
MERGFVRRFCMTKPRRPDIRQAAKCLKAQGGFMKWDTPAFTDMRFGFEITMYIATR